MKTLLLIRHAKAEWDDFGQKDISRSLSERGIKQAHCIANSISAKGLVPDMMVSSSAKRTVMTTQILLSGMDAAEPQVQYRDDLYLAEADTLFAVARQADDSIESLAIVAHNPGLSELSNHLLSNAIGDMSTASVVAITWPVRHWSDISAGSGTLSAHLRP